MWNVKNKPKLQGRAINVNIISFNDARFTLLSRMVAEHWSETHECLVSLRVISRVVHNTMEFVVYKLITLSGVGLT